MRGAKEIRRDTVVVTTPDVAGHRTTAVHGVVIATASGRNTKTATTQALELLAAQAEEKYRASAVVSVVTVNQTQWYNEVTITLMGTAVSLSDWSTYVFPDHQGVRG